MEAPRLRSGTSLKKTKMRRVYHIVVSTLAVFAFLPSCQEKLEEPINENEPFKISVSALLEAHEEVSDESSDAGTRALIENTGTNGGRWILATWEAGDKVYVYKVSSDATTAAAMFKKVGVLTATKNGVPFQDMVGDEGGSPGRRLGNLFYETDLTGEIDADLELGSNDGLLFSYKHELGFSYTGQVGTLADIDANYDYALCYTRAKVHHDAKTIEIPGKLHFTSQQAIVRFELIDEAGNPLTPSKLTLEASDYRDSGPLTPVRIKPTWGIDDMFESVNYTDYISIYGGYPTNFDSVLEIAASSNIVYVAIRGNYLPKGSVGSKIAGAGDLFSCVFDLTATVGDDTYSYHRGLWSCYMNTYHEVRVRMKKKTTSD